MEAPEDAAMFENCTDLVQLKPFELLDDIMNTVSDYCEEGFDALEKCILSNIQVDEFQARLFLQGSAHLFRQLQADLAKHMQEFERAALRTSLNIPAGLILNQAALAEDGPRFTAEDEQRVDSQLSKLRQEIQEVRQARRDVEAQKAAIDREIRSYGDTSDLAAVTEAAAGKENLAEDAHALAAAAVQLAALLPRIRAKQAQRDAAAADATSIADPKQAALLAERDIMQRKTAMGSMNAADLRNLREQLRLDT
ncbi:g6801 [Coccomyxa elongata]